MTDAPPELLHVPAGCDPTGVADVSDKLTSWMTKFKDRAPIAGVPGATYRVDKGLTMQYANNLDLSQWDGGQRPIAKIFSDDPALDQRNRVLFRAFASNPITIGGGMKIHGPNYGNNDPPNYDKNVEGQAGISVSNMSDGVLIDGVVIIGTLGDGIYVGENQCGIESPKNVTIRNCRISNVGRQGIGVNNCEQLTIKGGTISNTGHSAIDLEPWFGTGIKDVLIDGVQTWGIRLCFVAAMGVRAVTQVTIQNCHANEGLLVMAHPPRDQGGFRQNWQILNNSSDWTYSAEQPPFNVTNVQAVTIAGNHQPAMVGPTPQTRTWWTEQRMAQFLLGNGCRRVTVGASIYNNDGTVAGPSGLPANTWR